MIVLVLGVTGMLGNAVYRVLSEDSSLRVFGTIRRMEAKCFFIPELLSRLILVKNIEDHDQLKRLFVTLNPNIVIICTSLRNSTTNSIMNHLSLFSLLPHYLAHLCKIHNARLIQISSDGVFSGSQGGYTEYDLLDASDVYGITKLLGEVKETARCHFEDLDYWS